MAHKKAGGSVQNGRDSVGQRLRVKAGDGQTVTAGTIIVRQRGMTFSSGPRHRARRDYTVFATVDGTVKFEHGSKSEAHIRVEAAETAPTTTSQAARRDRNSRRSPSGRWPGRKTPEERHP